MFNANQFSQRLQQCANGELAVGSLEEWFDANSWDVHQSGNEPLADAVFEFEELYAAYAAGRLAEKSFLAALARLSSTVHSFDQTSLAYAEVSAGGCAYYAGTYVLAIGAASITVLEKPEQCLQVQTTPSMHIPHPAAFLPSNAHNERVRYSSQR